MEMNTQEFSVLADMLSTQRLAVMEAELAKQKEQTEFWRQRYEEAERRLAATDMKNMILTNYIVLSMEKIKSFVKGLYKMEQWAFLRAFIQWSLPEELMAQERGMVEQVMPMPEKAVVRIDRAGDVVAEGGTKVVNEYAMKKGEFYD